jgi:multidrug efflux pump subunit AcrA (membrane-fusion protein)
MLSTISLRKVPVGLRAASRLAGLALVVSGCHRSAAPGKEVAPTAASAVHVETVVAAASEVPQYVFVTGSLVAAQQADVAAGTPGRVVRTFVERGTTSDFLTHRF